MLVLGLECDARPYRLPQYWTHGLTVWLTRNAHGKIDAEVADREWVLNTNPAQQRTTEQPHKGAQPRQVATRAPQISQVAGVVARIRAVSRHQRGLPGEIARVHGERSSHCSGSHGPNSPAVERRWFGNTGADCIDFLFPACWHGLDGGGACCLILIITAVPTFEPNNLATCLLRG